MKSGVADLLADYFNHVKARKTNKICRVLGIPEEGIRTTALSRLCTKFDIRISPEFKFGCFVDDETAAGKSLCPLINTKDH